MVSYLITFQICKQLTMTIIQTDFHLSANPAPLDHDLVIDSPDSFLQKLKQTNPTTVIFTVTDPIPNPPIPNPALPKLLTSLYRSEFCSLSKTEPSSRGNSCHLRGSHQPGEAYS